MEKKYNEKPNEPYLPWPVWHSWLEHRPITKCRGFDPQSGHVPRLQVQSPVWAHMNPGSGAYRRQPVDVSLLHRCFFSLPSSLSKSKGKKMSLGED